MERNRKRDERKMRVGDLDRLTSQKQKIKVALREGMDWQRGLLSKEGQYFVQIFFFVHTQGWCGRLSDLSTDNTKIVIRELLFWYFNWIFYYLKYFFSRFSDKKLNLWMSFSMIFFCQLYLIEDVLQGNIITLYYHCEFKCRWVNSYFLNKLDIID